MARRHDSGISIMGELESRRPALPRSCSKVTMGAHEPSANGLEFRQALARQDVARALQEKSDVERQHTMNTYFRCVAVDFDGTLTEGGRPSDDVLEAIATVRGSGRKVLLVTGRMLPPLKSVFPDVEDHFDGCVVENGAVILDRAGIRALAPPVCVELDDALRERGVPFERGQVILASKTVHDAAVMDDIRRLGLECQLVHNRSELMIVPPGISKGLGLFEALGDLGLSHHNVIGIGDAENDHSLLTTCELGVAVANAVDSLKGDADIILPDANGAGVASFLRGPLLRGESTVQPQRWRIELGSFREGLPATIPASQINVLVTGGSKTGKSYLAGVLAERLIALGYSICVLDPEGDYEQLDALRGVLSLGGKGPLPPPEEVARLLRHRFGSVIVNMSMLSSEKRHAYTRAILPTLEQERDTSGLPHWILVDEAHAPFGGDESGLAVNLSQFSRKGYCLVTYLPGQIHPRVWEELDVIVALPERPGRVTTPVDPLEVLDRTLGWDVSGALQEAQPGKALLWPLRSPDEARLFTIAPRGVGHVRHWHKYTHAQVAPSLRFFFQTDDSNSSHQWIAGNLQEFHQALSSCSESTVRHHASHSDFSRWIRDVIQDALMAEEMRKLERSVARSGSAEEVSSIRDRMLRVLEIRYFD